MSPDSARALDVFFSYSHRDEALRDELETHLALLKREGMIRTWHDRRIGAGQEWAGAIDEHLESADLILLLVSPDFMASDYCFDLEMGCALKRHEAFEALVIPIILRPVDWGTAPFARLQALPTDAKPVTSWPDRDQAFLDVARGLRAATQDLGRRPRPSPPKSELHPEPNYLDDETQQLSQSLEEAYERQVELLAREEDTTAVRQEILDLRRRMREGGQLKAGDFLLEGRLRLLAPLGRGGFATVWKASDRKRRELVAVKVLHGQYAHDRSRRDRFFRGARKMAELQHQNVVRVIEELQGSATQAMLGHRRGARTKQMALQPEGREGLAAETSLRAWPARGGKLQGTRARSETESPSRAAGAHSTPVSYPDWCTRTRFAGSSRAGWVDAPDLLDVRFESRVVYFSYEPHCRKGPSAGSRSRRKGSRQNRGRPNREPRNPCRP